MVTALHVKELRMFCKTIYKNIFANIIDGRTILINKQTDLNYSRKYNSSYASISNVVFITLFVISILYFAFLTTQFRGIGDDIVFAKWVNDGISWQNMVTANGVNGRYLGNTLGMLFSYLNYSSFWWIRALFNLICMILLVVVVSKLSHVKKENFIRVLCLSSILLLSANEYAYCEFYAYSAGFMNYFVPTLIFVVNLFLLYEYLKRKTKCLAIAIIILVFISCFFVELITVYLLLSSIAFFIFCLLKKTNIIFSVSLVVSSFFGMLLMFSYGIICSDQDSVYRGSIFSNGLNIIFDNVLKYSYMLLFSHLILTIIISVISMIVIYSNWKAKKTKNIISLLQMMICVLGIVVSFMLRYGNWKSTPIFFLVSDIGVSVITIVYLINLGIILFVSKEKNNNFRLAVFFYFSIWVLSGILSMVSPIGWRCFFIIYVLILLICINLFELVCSEFSLLLSNLLMIVSLSLFVIHAFIGKGFNKSYAVSIKREQILADAIENHKKYVEVPDSVGFADSGSMKYFRSVYYYSHPGDLEIVFVPYDEWGNK